MLNLTPHPITIRCLDGSEVTFPPSGVVARVSTVESVIGTRDVFDPSVAECDEQGNSFGHRIPVVSRVFGKVTGMPEEGVECIVSSMVLDAVKGRRGVYAPDSGPTAIRGENGFVIAVTRLVAA